VTEQKGDRREERPAVGVSRRASPPPAVAWDPFERVYTAQGSIDREYASKRLPVLIELLRRHPSCFPARIDTGRLGEFLLRDDAKELRDAANQEAFEAALRGFSERHLHALVDTAMQKTLADALLEIARTEEMSRRDRAGAALGVALLSVPPDASGLRGRGLMDILLRVTMEEQTAQENMRRKARETEGGLSPEELSQFWQQYPALRWHHEERYRREVTHVLKAIEGDRVPPAISVDLALRGAARLLAAVAQAKSEGREVDSRGAEEVLRLPFVQDMADDGARVVGERWKAEVASTAAMPSDERRAMLRTLDMGIRLVEEHGPGTDAILFYLYMRAVVQGHYFVRDVDELEAARPVFGSGGLDPSGALSYAAHLATRGDAAAQHRVLIAAFEIWPEDANVRAAVEAMGLREEAEAKSKRLGPTYEEKDAGDPAKPGDATA
jgi:hypothetical protein